MKVLCINCKPDLSFFTKRGLDLNVTYLEIPIKFKMIKAGTTIDSNGATVDLYTPDCENYLKSVTGYKAILVGWNPQDYGSELKYTGGKTRMTALPGGVWWASVRNDADINNYANHELMHIICNIINVELGDRKPKDFMDSTLVNGVWVNYYKNNYLLPDPDSSFNQTWEGIKPFLPKLNNTMSTYKYFKLTEKTNSAGTHTVAELKPELVAKLDLTRGDAGIPFVIESGLRTPAENKAVGGVANSAHLTGEAVDIRCLTSEARYKIVTAAIKNGFNRIGIGRNYVHLDISKTLGGNVIWHYYK